MRKVKNIKASKVQNGDQKSRWRQTDTFSLKNRLERHLSGYFKTFFAFSAIYSPPRNDDDFKIQNGAQKLNNLFLAANWPIFYVFQRPFLRFVCPTSVQKTPFSLMIQNSRWRENSLNRFLSENSLINHSYLCQYNIQTANAKMFPTYPIIYQLFLFVDFFQNGGDIQDGTLFSFLEHLNIKLPYNFLAKKSFSLLLRNYEYHFWFGCQ
jgi:hypothetical protein